MIFKILALAAVFMVCEGTIPDGFHHRRIPIRFFFNSQGMRPGGPWNYQIINGRPVISGFPTSNSYVAFGLNPQTGQIEQTQYITQTRPGGPFINMVQNMLHVAGHFFGQITGAFGNAVGGALQTAEQFGQDIHDLTSPVISVTGITQAGSEKKPPQRPDQPGVEGTIRPPIIQPLETVSPSSVETVSEQAKSDFQTALNVLDQAIIRLQTLETNVQANFQNFFESEEGESALKKVSENINWAVNQLQNLKESAVVEPNEVLLSGQSSVNNAFDNIEKALVSVVGTQGRDFVETKRNELIKLFIDAKL